MVSSKIHTTFAHTMSTIKLDLSRLHGIVKYFQKHQASVKQVWNQAVVHLNCYFSIFLTLFIVYNKIDLRLALDFISS